MRITDVAVNMPAGISGIYKITNTVNNKCYIGKSSDVRKRIVSHLGLIDSDRILYKAFRKYGLESFTAEVVVTGDEAELAELEVLVIEECKSFMPNGYNMTLGGDGAPGYKFSPVASQARAAARVGSTHSEETKARMRAYALEHSATRGKPLSAEHKEKIRQFQAVNGNPRLGTVNSEETRAKISKALKGHEGRQWTDEERQKLSEKKKGVSNVKLVGRYVGELNPMFGKVSKFRKPVLVWEPGSNTPLPFTCVEEAANHLGVKCGTLRGLLNGRSKTSKIFTGVIKYQ